MKNKKKSIVVVLLVLIACGLTFYAMGIRQKQELAMYQNRITLFQKDRQFYTYEDAVQMRQRNEEIKEPFSYVIWGTEGTHLLENQNLGRSSRVEVYAVDGNSQLLQPSTAMLDGTITDGCLLGEKAAHAEYYKGGYRIEPDYVKGMAVRICFIAGVVFLMVIFLRFHAKIPEDMIPTKWSDFAFWSRWGTDKAERMADWVECEKYAPELEYLGKSVRAVGSFVITYLCYLLIRIFGFGRNLRYKEHDHK